MVDVSYEMPGVELVVALLREGYPVRFVPTGSSMAPAVEHGDIVEVDPIDPRGLAPGDIVLVSVDERLLAHRIVGLWRDGEGALLLITRGDNNDGCDKAVPASAVLGRIVHVERPPWRDLLDRMIAARSRLRPQTIEDGPLTPALALHAREQAELHSRPL